MYITRPLSRYRSVPEAISIPPEGPNSGYLVLQDKESTPTCFFGLIKSSSVEHLPFPQNKILSIEHEETSDPAGRNTSEVYLIPVVNLPLSSNRYYIIKADGKHKGVAYASSKEEDMGTSCFCFPRVQDVKPRPLDPNDIYQQFQFSEKEKSWTNINKLEVMSVAHDGHPPSFLFSKGWTVKGHTPKNFTLGEANGLNSSLRDHRYLDFNFPLSQESSNSMVVGKWYCPFMFIKDGTEKDQIKKSMFYLMSLEQRWECIFSTPNSEDNKSVNIDILIPTETVRIGPNGNHEAVQVEKNGGRGVVWFTSIDGTQEEVGLSRHIVERMVWEEEKVGWVKGRDKQVRVTKQEECEGKWTSYGCYALVERFVLRRNDGSLVLTYDFRHVHQLKSKWE